MAVVPKVRLRDSTDFSKEALQFNQRQTALLGRPILVTISQEGKVILQKEIDTTQFGVEQPVVVSHALICGLPPGRYEVKFEGDGFETTVKRGLQITKGNILVVIADLVGGHGVRVIEYGKDGDPLRDILDRLKALESAVEELKRNR